MSCCETCETAFPGCTNYADQVFGRLIVRLSEKNSFLARLFSGSWSVAGVVVTLPGEFCFGSDRGP